MQAGILAHPEREEQFRRKGITQTMTPESGISGGAAAAGGFSFQANIGAIAGINMLRGTPVQWTDGLTGMAPVAVCFETAGPGDDLSLELADSCRVEIQVKKGLRADQRFWSALGALCDGVHNNRCHYGILVVCPNSSKPVRQSYALALERIGSGRNDGASPEQVKLGNFLARKEYDAKTVCARIRIRMVSALDNAGGDIAAARNELAHVCADRRKAILAWQSLCQDALLAIENKSRRTVGSLSARLRSSGIDIGDIAEDLPVAISNRLLRWTMSRTERFEVLGIRRPLLIDQAWLELSAMFHDEPIEQATSVEQSLVDYRTLGEKSLTGKNVIEARTIGTFRKLCVVVGGPGSGKSLLLKVIAREFAKDSCVSLRIRLRDLATRMEKTGCGVEEGLMRLGVDETGVTQDQLRAASLSDLVLLCDGLDECGERQTDIAAGLKGISTAHPTYRIVVTTRPIGYRTSELFDWRHYTILPLPEADTAKHLERLCRCAFDEDRVEKMDKLLPRIRSYLKEGTASEVFARSPLLLAFGAALFLTWEDPSKTKVETYQRVFQLIDDPLAGQQSGLEPPVKAIRDSVLNELGWLVTTSPLRPAKELQRLCAKSMEQALAMTHLNALAVVESAINYWEGKGVIERLGHPGSDLITFIHKTCGEYAAALHLSEMELDEARTAILPVLSNLDWDEILDFVTRTPLVNIVAELLVTEYEAVDSDQAKLNHLLRVLVRPDVSLSPTVRMPFVEHVFAIARSEDRQKVYQIGLCLTEHDLSRIPEAEDLATTLASSSTEWSRLVGWAILACHFPDSTDESALEDALTYFMEHSKIKDFFVLRYTRFPFGPIPFPERGVFENFMLGASKSLLPGKEPEFQSRLIAEICKSQSGATIEFVSRFKSLLRDLGREDALMPEFSSKRFAKEIDFSAFEAKCAEILTNVVPSAFLEDDPEFALETDPKSLAAFFKLAGIWDVPADDVNVWLSNESRLDAVHTLLRGSAYVFQLPVEKLAAEARQVIAIVESMRQDRKRNSYFDLLPKVDVAEVEWSRANHVDIDMDLVEGLVHHPSQWVQILATLFINERLHDDARRNVLERLLETGTGNTLYWAALLTAELPDGCEMVVRRLEGRDAAGLHHLFDNLKSQARPITPSCLGILENGLLNRGAKTAESAARWCQDSASTEDTWLVDLLRTASDYWIEHEEPYPENGGITPNSPREGLLRTLCRIAPPTFQELVQLTDDPRSDVRNAAIDGVIMLAKKSSDEKSKVVEGIAAKRFSSRLCEKLLRSDVQFQPEDLLVLCGLCSDQDPSYRMVAVRRVLTHYAIDPEKALSVANSMRSDNDGNVRDAVHQFLERRTED